MSDNRKNIKKNIKTKSCLFFFETYKPSRASLIKLRIQIQDIYVFRKRISPEMHEWQQRNKKYSYIERV